MCNTSRVKPAQVCRGELLSRSCWLQCK